MRLRSPKFPTTDEINNMTLAQATKDMKRKYAVKHTDGWEQGLHWNTDNKQKAVLFNSYSEASDILLKGSKVFQTY